MFCGLLTAVFFFIMFMLFYRHRGIMHTNEEKAT